ncbi:unnamed protein product, partial [Oppiella nova]
ETSLHLAAYHKNKNIIELLVKCGVDVNAQVVNLSYALLCVLAVNGFCGGFQEGKSGKSVLHWSVETQNLDLIQFLVKTCKAAVNVRSYAGHTPLHYAWILFQWKGMFLQLNSVIVSIVVHLMHTDMNCGIAKGHLAHSNQSVDELVLQRVGHSPLQGVYNTYNIEKISANIKL